MIQKSLKISLKLVAIILLTAFTAQAQSDSITCIETKKIDFFIASYLNEQRLERDTAIEELQLKDLKNIVQQNNYIITGLSNEMVIKDTIIADLNRAYLDVYQKKTKQRHQMGLYKASTLILLFSSLLFGAIILLR